MELDLTISKKRARELTLRETAGMPPQKVSCIEDIMEAEYDPIVYVGPPAALVRDPPDEIIDEFAPLAPATTARGMWELTPADHQLPYYVINVGPPPALLRSVNL